jgi:hypothetical protein
MEKKRRAIGDLLEKVSSPIWLLFWYWGGDREAAEVALNPLDEEAHDLATPTRGVFRTNTIRSDEKRPTIWVHAYICK